MTSSLEAAVPTDLSDLRPSSEMHFRRLCLEGANPGPPELSRGREALPWGFRLTLDFFPSFSLSLSLLKVSRLSADPNALCFNFEASSFGLDMTFPTPSRMLPPTLLRPAPSLCDDLGRRPLSCSSDTFLRYSSNFFCCCAIVCADFWFFFSNSCLMRVCCCRSSAC